MYTILKEKTLVLLIFFVIGSCVTINIYFPAAAVEKAADKIVEEVWGGQKTGPEEERPPAQEGQPESRLEQGLIFSRVLLGPSEAVAQEADIEVTTPAIRALKESMKGRAETLKPFLDKGNVGITNDGMLLIRSREGLNLQKSATLARLVEAENSDRDKLYAEIAQANNFPPDRIADIKAIFAKSWARNAKQGWWLQDADGQWAQK